LQKSKQSRHGYLHYMPWQNWGNHARGNNPLSGANLFLLHKGRA
jgi:hypothetical protein